MIIKSTHTHTHTQKEKKEKKKRTCRIVDFAFPADHGVKLKENKKDKYLDLAWEWKWLSYLL